MAEIERFIVSTGRAGSTLLSKLLTENHKVLSLSEFIGSLDFVDRFSAEPVSGEKLAFILSQTDEIGLLMHSRGQRIKESAIQNHDDLAEERGRWGVGFVPALFAGALPLLTDDPVKLFDEILAFAHEQPARPMADQYRAMFGWLVQQFGREAWVERTGASFRWFPDLRRTFPDARYVHVHRDGPEAALSMREHNWFVLAAEFAENPPDVETLEWAFEHPGTDDSDPYARFYGRDMPPVESFGRYWSYLIANGVGEFRHLRAEQILDVRFEDLSSHPGPTLTRIASFFDLPDDPGWIDRASAKVNREPSLRAPELSDDERHRLDVACLPGQVLLGRVDPAAMWQPYARIREAFAKAAG